MPTSSTQTKSEGLISLGKIITTWGEYIGGTKDIADLLTVFGNNKQTIERLIVWIMANTKDIDIETLKAHLKSSPG